MSSSRFLLLPVEASLLGDTGARGEFWLGGSSASAKLASALEPGAALQDRLANLVLVFKPAKTLHQEFSVLAQSFEEKTRRLL